MEIIKHANNIHELKLIGTHAKIAMFSDLHWDNPKCDWEILKKRSRLLCKRIYSYYD